MIHISCMQYLKYLETKCEKICSNKLRFRNWQHNLVVFMCVCEAEQRVFGMKILQLNFIHTENAFLLYYRTNAFVYAIKFWECNKKMNHVSQPEQLRYTKMYVISIEKNTITTRTRTTSTTTATAIAKIGKKLKQTNKK